MEILRRGAGSPEMGSPKGASTPPLDLIHHQHHSVEVDTADDAFPIDLSAGTGRSSSGSSSGDSSNSRPGSSVDSHNNRSHHHHSDDEHLSLEHHQHGRNGGLDLSVGTRSPSSAGGDRKETPGSSPRAPCFVVSPALSASSRHSTSSSAEIPAHHSSGARNNKRARLDELVSNIRRATTTTSTSGGPSVTSSSCPPSTAHQHLSSPADDDGDGDGDDDFRRRSFSDSEMHIRSMFNRSSLLLKTCSLARIGEEATDSANNGTNTGNGVSTAGSLLGGRLPELIKIKGENGGQDEGYGTDRVAYSPFKTTKRPIMEPEEDHSRNLTTSNGNENRHFNGENQKEKPSPLHNLFDPARLAQQALLDRLGAQLATAGAGIPQQPTQDRDALLERILQLNISTAAAAAMQQQQQQQQQPGMPPGLLPDALKTALGGAQPPPGYPPFLYYSAYYAQMLQAAQAAAAWQTQQAVMRGQVTPLGPIGNASLHESPSRDAKSYETNPLQKFGSPTKFPSAFPANASALLAAAVAGRRHLGPNDVSPTRNDDDDEDANDLDDEDDEDGDHGSFLSHRSSPLFPGDGGDTTPPGLVIRKRAPRALTGKHVRQGTGASPSVLLSLRKKIEERLRLREQLGITHLGGKFGGRKQQGRSGRGQHPQQANRSNKRR